MIKLKLIKDVFQEDFDLVWGIYRASFPENEQRELASQKECFKNSNYSFYAICCAGDIIGLLTEWNFKDFILVEHFAIKKQSRHKGIGTKVLKDYFNSKKKLLISEVERPKSEIDAKRIDFLRNLGAHLNRFDYTHPAYSKKKESIQLFLMGYPRKISKKDYIKIRDEIYKEVFSYKEPI